MKFIDFKLLSKLIKIVRSRRLFILQISRESIDSVEVLFRAGAGELHFYLKIITSFFFKSNLFMKILSLILKLISKI
jgi:hypothetical protein